MADDVAGGLPVDTPPADGTPAAGLGDVQAQGATSDAGAPAAEPTAAPPTEEIPNDVEGLQKMLKDTQTEFHTRSTENARLKEELEGHHALVDVLQQNPALYQEVSNLVSGNPSARQPAATQPSQPTDQGQTLTPAEPVGLGETVARALQSVQEYGDTGEAARAIEAAFNQRIDEVKQESFSNASVMMEPFMRQQIDSKWSAQRERLNGFGIDLDDRMVRMQLESAVTQLRSRYGISPDALIEPKDIVSEAFSDKMAEFVRNATLKEIQERNGQAAAAANSVEQPAGAPSSAAPATGTAKRSLRATFDANLATREAKPKQKEHDTWPQRHKRRFTPLRSRPLLTSG